MSAIHKHELKLGRYTYVLPEGAQILSVAFQRDVPFMWVLVDPDRPRVPRNLFVAMTGEQVDASDGRRYRFIGTSMTADHDFVIHVFEEER